MESEKEKFEDIKKVNREKKESVKLNKKIAKKRAVNATIGNVVDLQESFQKVFGEQRSLSYQTNLNLRALFKLLIDRNVIDEKELGTKIRSLLDEDRKAFAESQNVRKEKNEKQKAD